MRKRTLPEMLRDSHAGSVIVAKLIADAIGLIVVGISFPLPSVEIRIANWFIQHALRDVGTIQPGFGEDMFLFTTIPAIFVAAVLLAIGYVVAGWVYAPSPTRRRISIGSPEPLNPSA